MHLNLPGALLLALPLSVMAGDPATSIRIPDPYPAQWATRLPQAVSVIDRDTIALGNAKTLSEALSGQAGLQVADLYGDGTTTSVDVRGFGAAAASNVLILVDGRRLNNAADIGAPALDRIPLDRIERIEILRGSAGVRYGNQAVGGVINIITRDATLPAAHIEAGLGSDDEYRAGGAVTAALTADLSVRALAAYREAGNYRHHNDLERENGELGLDYRHDRGRIVAEVTRSDEHLETPGSLFADEVAENRRQSAAVYADDYVDTRSTTARIGLDHEVTDDWSFTGDLNWREEQRDFVTSFRAFAGTPSTQDRRSWRFTPTLLGSGRWGSGQWDLRLGLDFERTDYRLETSFGVQAVDQETDAAFVEGGLALNTGARLHGGLRHTRVRNAIDNNGDAVSLPDEITVGTLGFEVRPAEDWRLFARADQNFRFATVDEHTNIVFGQPVGIDNQTGTSYEAGIERWSSGWDLRLTAYQLDLEDEISFNADTFTNTNLERTRRRGFTTEGQWRPASGWQFGAQYTYTEAEITSGPFSGSRVPLVAEHSARLFAESHITPALSALGEAVYTGEQWIGGDFNNDFTPLDASTVVNAAFTYETQGWRIRGRVDNLFNEIYDASAAVGYDDAFTRQAAFFPAPERRLSLTLRYDF